MKSKSTRKFILGLLLPCLMAFAGVGCGSNPAADQPICAALGLPSTQDFLDMDNTATFDQLLNDQDVFLFIPAGAQAYDGINVVRLDFAKVEFDFEGLPVDPSDFGGFHARWRVIFLPHSDALAQQIADAVSTVQKQALINQLKGNPDRVESLLSGPFLQNDCEWGDTDEIGTQTLTYENYALLDWDFFPGGTDRVLGVLFESDEGFGDDLIVAMDISVGDGPVVLESSGEFLINLTSLADVPIQP